MAQSQSEASRPEFGGAATAKSPPCVSPRCWIKWPPMRRDRHGGRRSDRRFSLIAYQERPWAKSASSNREDCPQWPPLLWQAEHLASTIVSKPTMALIRRAIGFCVLRSDVSCANQAAPRPRSPLQRVSLTKGSFLIVRFIIGHSSNYRGSASESPLISATKDTPMAIFDIWSSAPPRLLKKR